MIIDLLIPFQSPILKLADHPQVKVASLSAGLVQARQRFVMPPHKSLRYTWNDTDCPDPTTWDCGNGNTDLWKWTGFTLLALFGLAVICCCCIACYYSFVSNCLPESQWRARVLGIQYHGPRRPKFQEMAAHGSASESEFP
jgi:hypothetical protein